MKSSFQSTASCLLIVSLLLCSCKEQKALLKEKVDLEVAVKQAKEEYDSLESRIAAVGPSFYSTHTTMEVQVKAADTASQQLTQEITALGGKAERLDAAIKQFRPRVDAYKAKYLR